MVLSRTKDHFGLYGVGIDKLSGLYISLPEEVQKAVDTRASMQITRHQLHAQYQSGQAMREAATNPSGGAAGGRCRRRRRYRHGLHHGRCSMRSAQQQPAPGTQPPAPQQVLLCPKCGAPTIVGAKFCDVMRSEADVEHGPLPQVRQQGERRGTSSAPSAATR